MSNGADLLDRARQVASELRRHKSAARIARQGAQAAAAELAAIRAECERRGIAFAVAPDDGPGRMEVKGRA